jgi:hypothetical protein
MFYFLSQQLQISSGLPPTCSLGSHLTFFNPTLSIVIFYVSSYHSPQKTRSPRLRLQQPPREHDG